MCVRACVCSSASARECECIFACLFACMCARGCEFSQICACLLACMCACTCAHPRRVLCDVCAYIPSEAQVRLQTVASTSGRLRHAVSTLLQHGPNVTGTVLQAFTQPHTLAVSGILLFGGLLYCEGCAQALLVGVVVTELRYG